MLLYRHRIRRASAFLLAVLWAASGWAADLELRFIDVGQGDAILVRNDGASVLIDTGPDDAIADQLTGFGVTSLDLLAISHNHADHLGGADAVLAAFTVRRFLDNALPAKTKSQEVVLRLAEARGAAYLGAEERVIELGNARLRVIQPVDGVPGDAQNNHSLALLLERGKFRALMTGDSEVELINAWLQRGVIPDVDVLKAAHHGSRNGVTPAWLTTTKPEVVVVSCGAGNDYGHPHPMALRYYQTGGRRVLRTDQVGDIIVWVSEDGAYRVETARLPAPVAPVKVAESPPRCCRTCRTGKACGDACVPRDRPCSRPPGCACDAP